MACGRCKAKAAGVRAMRASRAAMCAACGASRGIDPTECRGGSGGVPVALRITAGDCPKGRHPDPESGLVRWWGVTWYGVPMPVRLWLGFRHPKHPHEDRWPGCGCMKWAKDRITALGILSGSAGPRSVSRNRSSGSSSR